MRKLCFWLICCCTVSFANASEILILPVTFDKGVPIVSMTINNNDILFIVDLGASDALYLSNVDAKKIPNLTYTGKKLKSFDLTGKVTENNEIVVDDLVVSGLHFGKISGRSYIPWGVNLGESRGLNPDISVVGLSFFEGKKVLFDFAAKTMKITDAATTAMTENDEHWISVPYVRSAEGLILVAKSGFGDYRMVLDSPSTLSIIKSKSLKNHEEIGQCKLNLGPNQVCQYISISVVGSSELTPVLMNLPEKFKADGILGRDFFERNSVLLDMANQTLQIKSHL